jgi:regulator of extracellular matrix RemA (YlzA/DUF370 family)
LFHIKFLGRLLFKEAAYPFVYSLSLLLEEKVSAMLRDEVSSPHNPYLMLKIGVNMKFVNVGYGNLVAAERIVLIASPESAPVKRLIQDAKDDSRAVDLTCGKKTRAIIVTDTEHVIMSALPSEKIASRASGEEEPEETTALPDA